MKIFANKHFEAGTHIITDGFVSYNLLDDGEESVWAHEAHKHSGIDFGLGKSTISHIEYAWARLIESVKIIYGKKPVIWFTSLENLNLD